MAVVSFGEDPVVEAVVLEEPGPALVVGRPRWARGQHDCRQGGAEGSAERHRSIPQRMGCSVEPQGTGHPLRLVDEEAQGSPRYRLGPRLVNWSAVR